MTRRRLKKYPPLSRAQQKLVVDHKWISGRLAYGAKCLTGGHTGSLTRDDLESIANFALCVAATRYKPEMNIKFSTYAWNTARGYIRHALRDYSRMVRTPRWVATFHGEVRRLVGEGKTYSEISEEIGIDEMKILICEMSRNNYHVSYDSSPEDWVTPEFVYHVDEVKSSLASSSLINLMRSMTDAEMGIMMKYVDESPMTPEELEWATEKFYDLHSVAHGLTEEENKD